MTACPLTFVISRTSGSRFFSRRRVWSTWLFATVRSGTLPGRQDCRRRRQSSHARLRRSSPHANDPELASFPSASLETTRDVRPGRRRRRAARRRAPPRLRDARRSRVPDARRRDEPLHAGRARAPAARLPARAVQAGHGAPGGGAPRGRQEAGAACAVHQRGGPPTGVLSQPGRAVVAGERLVGHRRRRGGGGYRQGCAGPRATRARPGRGQQPREHRAQRRGRPISVGRRGGGGVAVPRAASDVHRQPVPRRTRAPRGGHVQVPVRPEPRHRARVAVEPRRCFRAVPRHAERPVKREQAARRESRPGAPRDVLARPGTVPRVLPAEFSLSNGRVAQRGFRASVRFSSRDAVPGQRGYHEAPSFAVCC